MTTRRSPDGQIYTEVPVVPTHSQLDGRGLENQHPIEAITGLQDALDGKADAVDGKGLSTEDYTTEEKAKLDGIEDGAEENRIETVKVNGAALTPDEDRAVDVQVPRDYLTRAERTGNILRFSRANGSHQSVTLGDPVVGFTEVSSGTYIRLNCTTLSGGTTTALGSSFERGAQVNKIETVKVNGVALEPRAKAVDVEVPTDYGRTLAYSTSNGKLTLKDPSGATLSTATLPRKGVSSAAYSSSTEKLTLTLQDGSSVEADLSELDSAYTAGDGLSLANGAFSLSSQTERALADAAVHVEDSSLHVSQADRTKWNGVDNAVKTSGDQTVAGAKIFTGAVVVPTPQAASQAATKAYVDSVAGGGGGGGGVTYTAGEGLALEGTEFSLSSETQATLSAVAGKADDSAVVKLSGAQTVAGIKTFSSLPVIPTTTPTSNGQAASKKYVDDTVSSKAADAAVIHNTGNESIAGLKTFTTIPKIPTTTPTDNAQVASKAYVDAAVAGGGGGGGGTTYTAGTGLQLVGTEFSLDSATQTAVGAVSSKADDSAVVKLTGAQTVAGIKTFSSSPVVPTPTSDYQVATKKYVDENAGGGGGSGPWTSVGASEYTETMFNTLFTAGSLSDIYVAQKDLAIYIVAYTGSSSTAYVESAIYIPKGMHVPARLDFIRGNISTRVDMNLRLPKIFNVTGASGNVAGKVIESITSSGISVTVVSGTQSLTMSDVPYTYLTSNWSNTKNTLCIQYR